MRTFLGFGVGCLLLFVGFSGPGGVFAEDALPTRAAGHVQLIGEPGGLPEYSVVRAFPQLTFERPISIACPSDGSGNLFVAEQGGLLKVFQNDPETKKAAVALDISKQVSREHNEEGLLGLVFDPAFAKNRHLYVAYSSSEARQTVVARFTASGTRRHINKRTESLVLRQRQPTGSHNGGGLAFGPDGYLYISMGDGGEPDDERGHAQNLSDWLGSILRVDVNTKERYEVPDDNPLVGIQHVKPEIYAYGFANVRNFSFDPVTGDLWAGDAGAGRYEEIDLVQPGGNYGWNLFEGNERFRKGTALTELQPPVLALPRAETRRIVGGVVYRGKRLAGLVGAYVFADHETGALFALRFDGAKVTERKQIGDIPGVTHIAVDGRGELLMTSLDGGIYTLEPFLGTPAVVPFPQRLSETGLFTDIRTLTPDPSLVPFTVATPLWSDGAGKDRQLMLPGLKKISILKDGTYAFPIGTIFVKHFAYGDDLQTGRRLETRLLVRRDAGWSGYTYMWKDDGSDAYLIDGRVNTEVTHAGTSHAWTFPSRQDCASCHTKVAGEVLGFRREQLDVPFTYGTTTLNQLDALEAMGVFEGKNKRKDTWPAWAPEGDLDDQVRAYLDVNCAMCHQPDGPGNANIDLRWDTPLKRTGLVNQKPGMWNLDVYDARLLAPGRPDRSLLYLRMMRTDIKGMPTIAHNTPDEKALARIKAWIEAIKK